MLKILAFISITFLTLLMAWGIGWLWFATNIALATTPDTPTKAEAIIVFTGGNGRVNAGLNLLEKNIAPKLFISGVNENVEEKDIFKQWTNAPKQMPCCLYLGYEAKDTAGNAREIKSWIEKNNIKSFQLVTSSYHMPRAYIEVSKILPETQVLRYPVISTDFELWKERFWSLTFEEYNKVIFIWLKLGHT